MHLGEKCPGNGEGSPCKGRAGGLCPTPGQLPAHAATRVESRSGGREVPASRCLLQELPDPLLVAGDVSSLPPRPRFCVCQGGTVPKGNTCLEQRVGGARRMRFPRGLADWGGRLAILTNARLCELAGHLGGDSDRGKTRVVRAQPACCVSHSFPPAVTSLLLFQDGVPCGGERAARPQPLQPLREHPGR